MADDMPRLSTEELVAHAASVRALAAHLLHDAHLGEDVAQDAAVVALTAPPERGTPFGPWLRGVARHLAFRRIRTDARRRRREEIAAAPEERRDADVVERTELRQAVVAELLAMDDPYRRTLLLRYFEDLEPAEIARRDGVPQGTVRSRLSRGAQMLRARLDARYRGERGAWAAPLVALLHDPVGGASAAGPSGAAGTSPSAASSAASSAAPRTAPPSASAVLRRTPSPAAALLAAGVLLMALKTIAAVVLSAAVAGAAWWALRDDSGAAPSSDAAHAPQASSPHEPANAPRPRVNPVTDLAAADAPVAAPTPVRADVWVAGRVAGEGRHPAADVEVALLTAHAPPALTRTGADGAFRLPATLPQSSDVYAAKATVHARTTDGRGAFATVELAPSAADLAAGTLILGPAHALDVVVKIADAPAAGVRVGVSRRLRGVTDAAGAVRFDAVPDGAYFVEAGDPERGHAVASAAVPGSGAPVVLTLTRRDIVVTVVRKGTGEPVPGEEVIAMFRHAAPDGAGIAAPPYDPPLATAPTGADGTTTLRGAGRDEDVYLRLRPRGGAPASIFDDPFDHARCKPGVTTARIELPAPHTYRFRILAGDVAPPAEGTVLTLVPWTNSGAPVPAASAVVRNGEIVVEASGVERVSCFARTPDGALARLNGKPDGPEVGETTFRAERRIEVIVRDADGRPLRGVAVVAKDQGNNAMVPPVLTGDDGVATIAGLYGGLADVYVLSDPRSVWSGTRIGSVDLEKGSGRLEYVAPREVRVVLRVTIAGKSALPTRFQLGGARVVAENAAAGTLDVAVVPQSPGAAAKLWLNADGFQRRAIDVPAGAADGTAIDVDLVRGGTFRAHVAMPEDKRANVLLQRWNDAAARWEGVRAGPNGSPALDPAGDVVVASLAPGRYRMMDAASSAIGPSVDVTEGGTTDAGTFDLSRAGFARGKVVAPEGASFAGARIVVEGDGVAQLGVGPDVGPIGVASDGKFQVRVPGDRPVRVRVVHPTLRAAATGGAADVLLPRADVELRLERGPVATLRAQEAFGGRSRGGAPRVLVYAGEPSGPPLAELTPIVEDGALRFGLPSAGRCTLWIDAAPWAPLVLRGVTVGDADLDLGTQQFAAGSSIRVKLVVKSGQAAPRIAVWATRTDAPSYSRGLNSNGEAEVVLRGLGPGAFKVQLMQIMDNAASPPPARTVEVDGADATESVIEYDVR